MLFSLHMALQHPLPAALDSGERVLSLTAYTGRLALRPKGVFFFRLKVYERGGILIFKVYERLIRESSHLVR